MNDLQAELDRLISEAAINDQDEADLYEYWEAAADLTRFILDHRDQVVMMVKDEGGLEWVEEPVAWDADLSDIGFRIYHFTDWPFHEVCYRLTIAKHFNVLLEKEFDTLELAKSAAEAWVRDHEATE